MKKIILILIILVCSYTKTYAGWYKCYNYKGTIDKYPISFSIQITEDYFGEKTKKDYNINGVYKYDKHNNPIKLEGKIDLKNNKAYIYEIQNNKNTAVFEFNFSENECDGTWTDLNTKKSLPLHLSFISKLIDTSKKGTFTSIEILQRHSLPDLYFVGVYSKNAGSDTSQMKQLKIIKKSDNSVFQVLDFSNIESATGNIITIIYENVEVPNIKIKQLMIWNDVGRMGGYLIADYNPAKRKFKLDPKPIIDGPQ